MTERFNGRLAPLEREAIRQNVQGTRDPLERVEKLFEKLDEQPSISEMDPELLALLYNNARLVAEELRSLRDKKSNQ